MSFLEAYLRLWSPDWLAAEKSLNAVAGERERSAAVRRMSLVWWACDEYTAVANSYSLCSKSGCLGLFCVVSAKAAG